MNNSINYSGYVDMVLDSADDFELYGYDLMPIIAAEARSSREVNQMLHCESLFDEPWGE